MDSLTCSRSEMPTLHAALLTYLIDLNREIGSNGREDLEPERERTRALLQRVEMAQTVANKDSKD